MRFSVRHLMQYDYSAPVELGAHRLRLTPRVGAGVLHGHELTVTPAPTSRCDLTDDFGNQLIALEFAGEITRFCVESRFTLDTCAPVPPPADLPPLPWDATSAAQAAYLRDPVPDPTVQAFAAALADEAGGDALVFLDLLNRQLFTRTDRQIRLEGDAQTPAETLASARGACRDLAVLFIAAARAQGIPARFVSGYQAHAESVDGQRHLHAWVEVWLGQGWHGFDPTHGLAVGEGHVALCAAPDQAGTMPLEGGFWGANVRTLLRYTVEIETDG
ncbi:transglutaminase family protein [Paenirhodobacter sp. CAU 1674]|uniref:transglutaminase family protein n=1 Tax=Paenirhodobacter sp. CAU 1674 TaxID=3032596 RepID=UPI0023DA0BD2|nr:transglutaminase family protein [Paenirhodobacter sp. CAU 1674]MDF2141288.1 transglutaminase family protein [Paenirhodobacter sp. CAU 1674]